MKNLTILLLCISLIVSGCFETDYTYDLFDAKIDQDIVNSEIAQPARPINQHLTPAEDFQLLKDEIAIIGKIPAYRIINGYSIIGATPTADFISITDPNFEWDSPENPFSFEMMFEEDKDAPVRLVVHHNFREHRTYRAGVYAEIPIRPSHIDRMVRYNGEIVDIDSIPVPIRTEYEAERYFVFLKVWCDNLEYHHKQVTGTPLNSPDP